MGVLFTHSHHTLYKPTGHEARLVVQRKALKTRQALPAHLFKPLFAKTDTQVVNQNSFLLHYVSIALDYFLIIDIAIHGNT